MWYVVDGKLHACAVGLMRRWSHCVRTLVPLPLYFKVVQHKQCVPPRSVCGLVLCYFRCCAVEIVGACFTKPRSVLECCTDKNKWRMAHPRKSVSRPLRPTSMSRSVAAPAPAPAPASVTSRRVARRAATANMQDEAPHIRSAPSAGEELGVVRDDA